MEQIDVIFNEEKKEFEVWNLKTYDEGQVKSLLLIQTIDDVKQHLKEYATKLLESMERVEI